MKGTNGGIQLQLYQDGYANHNAINVYATQDGTFSAVLFDGPYKLVTKDKNGPWVNKRDTIYIEVKGKTLCEVKVTPYFTISDENIVLNNNTVSGTCNIQQIVQDSKISQVMLLVSQTTFVDENTNIGRQNLSNIAGNNQYLVRYYQQQECTVGQSVICPYWSKSNRSRPSHLFGNFQIKIIIIKSKLMVYLSNYYLTKTQNQIKR